MKVLARQGKVLTALRPVGISSAASRLPDALWLGVCFPQISLAAHPWPEGQAFAVFEMSKGKSRVYQANAAASAQGLAAGMALNAAYVLCQNLSVVLRDPSAEAICLQRYAQLATRFTPGIVLSEPDTLLLEIKQSLHLFGGLKMLHHQLSRVFEVPHIIACAPVTDAAELMARNGIAKLVRSEDRLKAALGRCEISSIPITDKLVQQLARCGLHQLRDLWRLPRDDLARRFGPDLLKLLDQLCGQRLQPRAMMVLKENFKTKHEFDKETDDIEQLLQAAAHLLQQAQKFLQTRASICEKITFSLGYIHYRGENPQHLDINVYAQQGGDTPAHFLPQLRERLQRMNFERAVITLVLGIAQIRPRNHHSGDLFKRRTQGRDSWQSLLNILCARLGKERVYQLDLWADHRPELAWRKGSKPGTSLPPQMPAYNLKRPAWLLSEPVKCLLRGFTITSDAERLEAGWWEDQDCRREYYQAIAPSGSRCWLYRDLQAANAQWYLHGLFA